MIEGSGFEEVVYQSGLCTPGGIRGVLSGKHYNRCWAVHELFAEASDRLFCEGYLTNVTTELCNFAQINPSEIDLNSALSEATFLVYEQTYNNRKDTTVLDGVPESR